MNSLPRASTTFGSTDIALALEVARQYATSSPA
jgi:hypothetical protein